MILVSFLGGYLFGVMTTLLLFIFQAETQEHDCDEQGCYE